jgi:hypothetical protein
MSSIPSSPFPSYYEQRLTKIGMNLYKFITYMPFRLEVISPNLYNKADLYHLEGKITNIIDKGKFLNCNIMTRTGEVNFFDFGKKLNYLRGFDINTTYQITLTKSNDYYNLVEIEKKSNSTSKEFILGSLESKDYFRPVYTLLTHQLRSKQLNKIHSYLKPSNYLLNIEGLMPANELVPQILDLRPIHKPHSLEEFNSTMREWTNFQTWLNLVFLDALETIEPNFDTLITPKYVGLLEEFKSATGITLSDSQEKTITNILKQITY